jgi:hypothetical protein
VVEVVEVVVVPTVTVAAGAITVATPAAAA